MYQETVDQTEFFGGLAEDGLADPEWADKLEYMQYAMYVYGNDNPDPNQSYIDFQQAEWESFKAKPQSGGTSLWRLDEDLHVSNEMTQDNSPGGGDEPVWGS